MTLSINHHASAETNEHRHTPQTRAAPPLRPTPRQDDEGYTETNDEHETPQ